MSLPYKTMLTVFFIVFALCLADQWAVGAGEDTSQVTVQSVKVAAMEQAADRLRAMRKAVIIVNGGDALRTKVMEDALALELVHLGVEVVSRSRVETLIAEKLNERIRAVPTKAEEEPKEVPPKAIEPVGAVQVAKAAGAQILILGTMLDERLRSSIVGIGKPGQMLEQPLVVVNASAQVIDVESDALLMILFGNWPNGTDIAEAATQLAAPIKAARKL